MSAATLFGRVAQRKSLGDLLTQEQRLRQLLWVNTSAAIARADPRINSAHHHFAHNWGNQEAKQALAQYQQRADRLNAMLRARLKAAKPSWLS